MNNTSVAITLAVAFMCGGTPTVDALGFKAGTQSPQMLGPNCETPALAERYLSSAGYRNISGIGGGIRSSYIFAATPPGGGRGTFSVTAKYCHVTPYAVFPTH